MTLLESHLEQISLSAKSIAELQWARCSSCAKPQADCRSFPPPKVFHNAMLGNHEITSLIRDTEPHECALFSIDQSTINGAGFKNSRRQTGFGAADTISQGRKSMYGSTEPRKESAVARVLGQEMLQEIQQSSGSASRRRNGTGGSVNVEILLRGAEKLCAVYPVAGAQEKVTALRSRHAQISESIRVYQDKITKQQSKVERGMKGSETGWQYQRQEARGGSSLRMNEANEAEPVMTEQDLQAEEEEIRELEARKRALEERVAGMATDLGGLLG